MCGVPYAKQSSVERRYRSISTVRVTAGVGAQEVLFRAFRFVELTFVNFGSSSVRQVILPGMAITGAETGDATDRRNVDVIRIE